MSPNLEKLKVREKLNETVHVHFQKFVSISDQLSEAPRRTQVKGALHKTHNTFWTNHERSS
jgi:hypothetical protein